MENNILDDQFKGGLSSAGSLDPETIKLINTNKVQLNKAARKLKNARNALLIYSGVIFLYLLYSYLTDSFQVDALFEGLIIGVMYLACGLVVKYHPKVALLTALIIFVLYWVFYILVDVSFLHRGIVFKGLMLYFLILGVDGAFDFSNKLKALINLGVSDEEIDLAKSYKRLPPTSLRKV